MKNKLTQVINAYGEKEYGVLSNNRKVEIIFYYKKQKIPEIIKVADVKCFKVDLQALSFCNVKEINTDSGDYVRIEAMDKRVINNQQHYYYQRTENGKAIVSKLIWNKKRTGKFWWRKRRLVAIIPKSSFDKFQFFTLFDEPCDGCTDSILEMNIDSLYQSHLYKDIFLIANTQFKPSFFWNEYLKVRLPEEYVDLNERYIYYSNVKTDKEVLKPKEFEINWHTKNGSQNDLYYYAKIYTNSAHLPYVYKSKLTLSCLNEYSTNSFKFYLPCGGGPSSYGDKKKVGIEIEPGVYMHNDTITAFLSIGLSHDVRKWRFSIYGGMNSKFGFYGNLRARFILSTFKLNDFLKDKTWQKMSVKSNLYKPYGNLYFGSELVSSFHENYQSFFDSGIHLGLSLNKYYSSKYSNRFYFQFGVAKDLLNRINDELYPTGKLGLVFNVF